MLGIASYDSDEEAPAAPAAAPAAAEAKAPAAKPGADGKPGGKAQGGKPGGKAAAAGLVEKRLKPILREIETAKSATAVVQTVRRCIDSQWDPIWGADALNSIAKRSTARTRKEWAADPGVQKLAERLRKMVGDRDALTSSGKQGVDTLLVALDGLRRMGFQEAEDQKDALERAILLLVADKWEHPVKSLARLFWLSAPLKLKGGGGDFSSLLPAELRARAPGLDGADVQLLIAAMRKDAARDTALLGKVVVRLQVQGIHAGLSATDLVEIAEGLNEIGMQDEAALRPLGQEILRRRGELTPDESHRVHAAYQAMKLPLPKVWAEPGASRKRDGAQIVTTQAFAPQEGHEKKRRGNHDVERTSPPRVVRDYKMMSY